jgi:hypothetical protein
MQTARAVRQPKHRVVREPKHDDLALLWKSGLVKVGDLFVTNRSMRPMDRRPGELPRKWELLVGTTKGRATVPKGSVAVYAGQVRSAERHPRKGNVMAIQHTFVFLCGRFAVLELDALEPA